MEVKYYNRQSKEDKSAIFLSANACESAVDGDLITVG